MVLRDTWKLRISEGNIKLGRIPSISFPPIVACGRGIPCAKDCYALKAFRQYPATRAAWNHNLEFYNARPIEFFEQLYAYLARKKCTFFRFHVAGDFLSAEYFRACLDTARAFPSTRFLAFTKRADLLPRGRARLGTIPRNFSIIQSIWPQWTTGSGRAIPDYPRAYMLDTARPDSRIPPNALRCPGNCETCGACFDIEKIAARAVVFAKH